MVTNITEKEYFELLDAYLEVQGPNPGQGFFARWGWYATQRNKFDASLKENGITVNGQE